MPVTFLGKHCQDLGVFLCLRKDLGQAEGIILGHEDDLDVVGKNAKVMLDQAEIAYYFLLP